jgi:predicted enzyme related to lactoylglutathione lyase
MRSCGLWLQDDAEATMGVTGIGGFFFRAKDPEALRAWYVEHLGVGSAPYGQWEMQAGPSVFSPFKADTDYFAADRQWMLNFRVDDLDGLCAKLRAAGIEVTTNPEWDAPGVGRFARVYDPEGNPIELWEPDPA